MLHACKLGRDMLRATTLMLNKNPQFVYRGSDLAGPPCSGCSYTTSGQVTHKRIDTISFQLHLIGNVIHGACNSGSIDLTHCMHLLQ